MKNLKITLTTLMLVSILLSTSSCKNPQKKEESTIESQKETTTVNEVPNPETPENHSKEKVDETDTHKSEEKK